MLELLGAVLVGGRSKRFGMHKAFALFLREPMVRWPLRAVRKVCREVALVAAHDRPFDAARALSGGEDVPEFEVAPEDVRVVEDRVAGAGPLGGLHAALLEARELDLEGVLLVACDMPLVTPGLLRCVAAEGHASGRLAAVPYSKRKALQPLCAWYAAGCLPAVAERLGVTEGREGGGPAERAEDLSMMRLVRELGGHRIPLDRLPPDTPLALKSANAPDDLRWLEEMYRRRERSLL